MTAFSGNWFQRTANRRKASSEAYRRLLRHALEPVYYASSGVPDTFEGRAQMVTVLTAVVCARWSLLGGADPIRLIGRLDELVLDGFDAAYREKGVGDASIARKVRKLAEGHTGLGKALFAAFLVEDLASRSEQVADILRRNGVVAPGREAEMGARLIALQAHQARQPDEEILQGRFDWNSNAPAQG